MFGGELIFGRVGLCLLELKLNWSSSRAVRSERGP